MGKKQSFLVAYALEGNKDIKVLTFGGFSDLKREIILQRKRGGRAEDNRLAGLPYQDSNTNVGTVYNGLMNILQKNGVTNQLLYSPNGNELFKTTARYISFCNNVKFKGDFFNPSSNPQVVTGIFLFNKEIQEKKEAIDLMFLQENQADKTSS